MTKEEIIDNLELYTVGRPKKDQVSITVEELQNLIDEIKILEQQPSDSVSLGVYNQVMHERDIAIEQLRELGYELGEEIKEDSK